MIDNENNEDTQQAIHNREDEHTCIVLSDKDIWKKNNKENLL